MTWPARWRRLSAPRSCSPTTPGRCTDSASSWTGSTGRTTRRACTGARGRPPAGDSRGRGRPRAPAVRRDRSPSHCPPPPHNPRRATSRADRRGRIPPPPRAPEGPGRRGSGRDGGWWRARCGIRDPRGDPERHRTCLSRLRGARLAVGAAARPRMGRHPPHGPAPGHRGRQPDPRGRGRDHGLRARGASGAVGFPAGRILRGGNERGPRRVRGGAAAPGGGDVVTRRRWMIAILGAWALTLGWLVKRQSFQSTGTRLAEARPAGPPGGTFYRLDVGGQQVGFASSTIATLKDSVPVEDQLVLALPALGHIHRTTAPSSAMVNRALRLLHVNATFDGDGAQYTARGVIAGDSVLQITLG